MEGTIASVPPQGGRKHPNRNSCRSIHQHPVRVRRRLCRARKDYRAAPSRRLRYGFGAEVRGPDERKTGEILKDLEPEDLLKFGLYTGVCRNVCRW